MRKPGRGSLDFCPVTKLSIASIHFQVNITISSLGRIATYIAAPILAFQIFAQPTTFEAASIRRNVSGGVNTQISVSGGRLNIENASVKTLVRNAYGILSFQLAGEPRWMDTEMYDIVATTGTSDAISSERLKALLQTLLIERFGLRVHWETREGPVYVLTAAKNGPKLKQSSQPGAPSINTQKGSGGVTMNGAREPISILASNLGNQLSRIVVDQTGLTGMYDWTLAWSPDMGADSVGPSLFTALQQQLGLRLEAQKGPMQVLVIDRVERASEN